MPGRADPVAAALAAYDLGELKALRQCERGYVNENWVVETARGRYLLKRRHPSLRCPDVIQAQHALLVRLHQAGFPVPALVPTVRGDTWLVQDGECYEVQAYIQGAPYDPARPAHLLAAATTLGRYHALAEGFAPPALHLGVLYSPALLRENLGRLARAWAASQDAPLARLVQRLDAHADDLARRFAEHGPLPHLVIHGDYYADNLLFDRDRIVGVVDWDKARWQPRVVELAEALIYFASPRPGPFQHLVYPGVLDQEPFARFLDAYARVIALTDDERRALPDYIHCIWSQVSLQRLAEKPRPPAARAALREVLTLANGRVNEYTKPPRVTFDE